MKKEKSTQKVKVEQVFTRFSIVEPTNRRSITPTMKTIENAFGKITVRSVYKLITRDIKIFLALATYIYTNKDMVEEAMVHDKKLLATTIDLYDFVQNYLHKQPSKPVYDAVIDSLNVLIQTYLEGEYFVKSDDGVESIQVRTSILPFTEIRTKKEKGQKGEKIVVDLFIFEWTLRMLTNPFPRSLFIDNYLLQQTNSSVATLLCLFLMSQPNATSYSKSFLIEQLGLQPLQENDNIDRELKKAFEELHKLGYIQSWHIEKRRDDTYYVFSRTKALPKPKKKK